MPAVNLFGIPVVVLSKLSSPSKDILIDAVEEVSVQYESNITKNPTETGGNVTDNIVNLPVVITMSGRFADSPLSIGAFSFFNPLQALSSAAASGLQGGLSVQAWEDLEALRRSKTPFDVVIQQGVYNSMVFGSLTAPRQKSDGTSMRFHAEMHEIVVTDLLVGSVAGAADVSADVERTAGAPENIGSQGTPPWGEIPT